MPTTELQVAIVLFPDVELLDFAGPHEVFTVANRFCDSVDINVTVVAESMESIRTNNGLVVLPNVDFDHVLHPDILLVPGGIGTRIAVENQKLVDWIRKHHSDGTMIASVCTGALLLAQAGMLSGLEVTTHRVAFDIIREIEPTCRVVKDRPFVDNETIVTSAGISAGIDMSLHLVQRLLGESVADETAAHMEYVRRH